MPSFKYELEVLTPLHVGSGEKIYPLEYVIDKDLIRVDMDKLFADSDFQIESFISRSRQRDFYLGNFDKKNALKYPVYKLDINPKVCQELINNIGSPGASILDFIKEGKNFYIPGSSIKGAMRTAILWKALGSKRNKKDFENQLKQTIGKKKKEKKAKGRSKVKREHFAISSEEAILGEPNYSPLRAIQIGDSAHLPFSSLNITCAKVLSKVGDGLKWKRLGRESRNVDRPEEATSTFLEAVKPASVVSGAFKIDSFLLKKETAASLNFKDTESIVNVVKTCNAFSSYHLEREIIFYRNLGISSIQNELENIKALSLQENEFLLHLAWGTGYEAKALGSSLAAELFDDIRAEWKLGRLGDLFPKTRKIVFESKSPQSVMGWVKMKLMQGSSYECMASIWPGG